MSRYGWEVNLKRWPAERIRISREVGARADDVFDRQKRIADWPQDAIQSARILVVGAGAIGNELIKNLMLIGARRLLICDFDTIEVSNLSRTVLFRAEDIGRPKAVVAAERAMGLALAPAPDIRAFEGDIVWDLGLGEILAADLILGCLDNVEARRAINRAGRLFGVPYIDAGIRELSVSVSVFGGAEGDPCYECTLSEQQLDAARRRYSCDNTRREFVEAENVPTVQIAAALAGALQAQEAVRLLAGDRRSVGRRLIWHGRTNTLRNVALPVDPACRAHARLPAVMPLQLDTSATLGEFLARAAEALGIGPAELELSLDRSFVRAAACRTCGFEGAVMRPLYRLNDRHLRCFSPPVEHCAYGKGVDGQRLDESTPTNMDAVWRLSSRATPDLLSSTLDELGLPPRHVVAVSVTERSEAFFVLTGEKRNRKGEG